jgi:hypothetical protein
VLTHKLTPLYLILLADGMDKETGQEKARLLLAPELEKYVNEDNARFEKEIMDWDTEQLAKVTATANEQQAGTSKRKLISGNSTTSRRVGRCVKSAVVGLSCHPGLYKRGSIKKR